MSLLSIGYNLQKDHIRQLLNPAKWQTDLPVALHFYDVHQFLPENNAWAFAPVPKYTIYDSEPKEDRDCAFYWEYLKAESTSNYNVLGVRNLHQKAMIDYKKEPLVARPEGKDLQVATAGPSFHRGACIK
jgi:hypothetical protein